MFARVLAMAGVVLVSSILLTMFNDMELGLLFYYVVVGVGVGITFPRRTA